MTLHYLVDTDWAIHYLHGHAAITARLDELQTEGLGLSVVSLAELYEGIYSSRDPQGNEQALCDFLAGVSVIGIDEETCQVFGKERGRLRAAGELVGDFDLFIGAMAMRHHLTLLTNNVATSSGSRGCGSYRCKPVYRINSRPARQSGFFVGTTINLPREYKKRTP